METVAVRAETQETERDAVVVVAIEGPSWQFNARATPSDWVRLAEVTEAGGQGHIGLRLGTVEGRAVWWQVRDGILHLDIGDNGPESSDVGFVLPLTVLRQVQEAVVNADEGWG